MFKFLKRPFHRHDYYFNPGIGCLECDCGKTISPDQNPAVARLEHEVTRKASKKR